MIPFVVNGAVQGGLIALYALGFALIFRATRHLHVAYGTVGISAVYVLSSLLESGIPAPMAVTIVIAVAMGVGAAIYVLIYRPLGESVFGILLSGLALLIVVSAAVELIWGPGVVWLPSILGDGGVQVAGQRLTAARLVTLAVGPLVVVGLTVALRITPWGKYMQALDDDRELAVASGIPVEWLRIGGYAAGTALSTLASVLDASERGVQPSSGLAILLVSLICVMLAGESVARAGLVGYAVGMLQSVQSIVIPSTLTNLSLYVLLGALVFGKAWFERIQLLSRSREQTA